MLDVDTRSLVAVITIDLIGLFDHKLEALVIQISAT
jgi:hypothetical protein